jgi:bifunctional non-homologous end joining protein LigD
MKHPLIQTQEVILCGWRPGQNRLTGVLGGLLLGAYDPDTGDLIYIGDVGTGFSGRERSALQAQVESIERREHPFANQPPPEDVRRAHWVEPRLVGEVIYRQFTRGAGRLRHTAWRGLREDRDPREVFLPQPTLRAPAEPAEPAPIRPVKVSAAPPSRDRTVTKAVSAPGGKVTVRAENRVLTLSNLEKVLYPADGFTKGEVIRYYSLISPVLLRHLQGRPVTMIRYPDGVDGQQFFEKNVPAGAPAWLRTVQLPSSGSRSRDTINYPLFDELPTLVWAANLAALELHVPQWTVGPGPAPRMPDRIVFDLDPGPGTTIVECCRVAERLHDILVDDGLTPVAKTSGSKGMQLYAGVRVRTPERTSIYAKALAERCAHETPDLVTAKMTKHLRIGKIFIDWSQNNPAKTTIAPYSLRGREHPTVSTPLTWEEVRACRRADQLMFTADDVLARIDLLGDLYGVLPDTRAAIPAP